MNPRDKLNDLLNLRLFEVGDSVITVGTTLLVLAILVATFVVARMARKGVARALQSRLTSDEQAVVIYSRLASLIVTVVGLSWALHTTGLNLTALFAAGSIFAVAVGFATQSLISNFVSGFVLRFEGAIELGDVLEVDGRMVKIQKMMMRAVVARNLDEHDIVIPNSVLAETSVINYTLRDKAYRLRTRIGVVYSSDMRKVRETLETAAREIPWRSSSPDPRILLLQFGNSSVDFDVSIWIDDPWMARRRRSDLNEALWWALQDAGITIAFPQVDVHFDTEVAKALDGRLRGDDPVAPVST
jgi:small-conductance mechanosensitive channel